MTNSAEQASVSIEKPVTNHNKRSTANTTLPRGRYFGAQDTILPAARSILNRGRTENPRHPNTDALRGPLAFSLGSIWVAPSPGDADLSYSSSSTPAA